jgi:hypothetical protein
MAKQILYGVGKSVLRDFSNKKDIVALSDLKDIALNFTANEEAVSGGDSAYPIAYLPKDKEITISATNATFSMKMLNTTQGATVATGAVEMTEFIEGSIPSDGLFALDFTPLAGSVAVVGFDEVDDELDLATGKFYVDIAGDQVKFDVSDADVEIEGVFKRTSSASAETISVMKDTLAKPLEFTHRIPIYDENSQIAGQGQLIVYKCKANGGFEFNLQPQTAYAPKVELKALDPKRADKKLWDFTIDPA